jgi:hypothetical protein
MSTFDVSLGFPLSIADTVREYWPFSSRSRLVTHLRTPSIRPMLNLPFCESSSKYSNSEFLPESLMTRAKGHKGSRQAISVNISQPVSCPDGGDWRVGWRIFMNEQNRDGLELRPFVVHVSHRDL